MGLFLIFSRFEHGVRYQNPKQIHLYYIYIISGRLVGITINGDLVKYIKINIYIYASKFVLSVNSTTWGASAVDHTETFFSGMGLFYIFLGLNTECVIRNPQMNHLYIYIDHFWKISGDNHQGLYIYMHQTLF